MDAEGRVRAARDQRGALSKRIALPPDAGEAGFRQDGATLLAWHRTPGYETYAGLGWRGVTVSEVGAPGS